MSAQGQPGPSPDTERILQHRAELFAELGKHPAFKEMTDELGRERDRRMKGFGRLLLTEDPVTPETVAYLRGYVAALAFIPLTVSRAEHKLEKSDAPAASEPDDERSIW